MGPYGSLASNDPFKAFVDTCERLRAVADPIASGRWTFMDAKGRKHTTRIEVGNRSRFLTTKTGIGSARCSLRAGPRTFPAMGVGPVDSLANASKLVREEIVSFHIASAPSESRPRSRRRHGQG